LSLLESIKFLESKGFGCIVSRFADSPGKAVHVAHQLGMPVCLRIDSPDIPHKSDYGGVKLNLLSAQEVRSAYTKMMEEVKNHFPNARINGVVVSSMASPGLELILGMSRDPQFGPVIVFGLGGVAVELYRDVSMRLLPSGSRGMRSRCWVRSRELHCSRDFEAGVPSMKPPLWTPFSSSRKWPRNTRISWRSI